MGIIIVAIIVFFSGVEANISFGTDRKFSFKINSIYEALDNIKAKRERLKELKEDATNDGIEDL